MRTLVHFLPLATTVLAAIFAAAVLSRYVRKGGTHLAWWGAGLVLYGVGTFCESMVTLFGWSEWAFRSWYISGALLGGAPLAQGTAYLLLPRRVAHVLAGSVVVVVAIASGLVLASPIDVTLVEPYRLGGRVLSWSWVRLFSPAVNLYALVMLVGGAAYSALRFRKAGVRDRFVGNVLIAVGGLLPGIGGSFTRAGYVEVLYVTELVGLLLIFAGYRVIVGEGILPRVDADVAWTTSYR